MTAQTREEIMLAISRLAAVGPLCLYVPAVW